MTLTKKEVGNHLNDVQLQILWNMSLMNLQWAEVMMRLPQIMLGNAFTAREASDAKSFTETDSISVSRHLVLLIAQVIFEFW